MTRICRAPRYAKDSGNSFANVVSGWNPAATQNTSTLLKAQDLQISAVTTSGSATRAFSMAHKMGLIQINMAKATAPETRTYTANSVNIAYDSGNVEFYALNVFDGTNLPYSATCPGTVSYFIVKHSGGSYSFTTPYKALNNGSTTGAVSQWTMSPVTAPASGKCTSATTGNPMFKNLGRLYSYTGTSQTYSVLFASDVCIYRMECWGAQGGNMIPTSWNGLGGLGGYVKGETVKGSASYLKSDQTLFIYVGGAGRGFNTSNGPWAGGWNGGGTAYGGASGGGGASDIRLKVASANTNVWNGELNSRVIVAGGGGGSNDATNGGYGGLTGGTGGGGSANNANGGTQTAGGTAYGKFGYCDYPGTSHNDGGGGGGGWYGGGRATGNGVAGGGGSSYISGYTTGGCSTNSSLAFNNSTAMAINGGSVMPDPKYSYGTNKASGYTTENKGRNDTGTDRGYVRITCMPYD